MVLGSGWGEVVSALAPQKPFPYQDLPGLGRAGVEGHAGQVAQGMAGGKNLVIFQGRRHWYEGEGWTPIAAPIYLMKQLGVKTVVLTNAAGGIDAAYKVGDLMILEDHINLMGENPLRAPHDPKWGPRFPDMSEIYNKGLRDVVEESARAAGMRVQRGTYVAVSGPSYETPAEIRMFRTCGAHAVGMSTAPEAILARSCGMNVAAISCISNLAAGISPVPLSHAEVAEATARILPGIKSTLLGFCERVKSS